MKSLFFMDFSVLKSLVMSLCFDVLSLGENDDFFSEAEGIQADSIISQHAHLHGPCEG